MKSPTEIAAEIAKLKALKSRVPDAHHFFGERLHDSIAAQIRVLEDDMDAATIDKAWLTEADDELRNAANDAAEWRDGNLEDAPSAEWEEIAA